MTITPEVALGVLSAPSSAARREAARDTWFRDSAILSGRVVVRFVLGSLGSSSSSTGNNDCARAAAAEAAAHTDVMLVRTTDCRMWFSPAKVHEWFRAALVAYPHTPWLGKTEDDALLWPTALLVDLAALAPSIELYGVMGWQGSCRMRGGHHVDCAGCYGGGLAMGVSLCRPAMCRAAHTMSAAAGRRCCQVGCPRSVRMTPFALGALDVRRRRLASAVAACTYAADYFTALSAHGEAHGAMCVSTDGAQGHAIGECVDSLTLADAGSRRLLDGSQCRLGSGRCAAGSVSLLHPLKRADAASWRASWRALSTQQLYAPPPLYEAALPSLAPHTRTAGIPQLQLLTERFGSFGREAHGNGSLEHAWAERVEYARGVIARSSRARRTSTPAGGRALVGNAGGGGDGRAWWQHGRRLKSEPVWSTNCSHLWVPSHGGMRVASRVEHRILNTTSVQLNIRNGVHRSGRELRA